MKPCNNLITYFLEKLSDINIKIRYHEGDAKTRLKYNSELISKLPVSVLDSESNSKLIDIIELFEKDEEGYHKKEYYKINNKKAIEIIKFLDDLQDKVEQLSENAEIGG